MKKFFLFLIILSLLSSTVGCVPLIVGAAVGALGGYAASKDTIQGDSDIEYDRLWNAAVTLARIRGTIKTEDYESGYIRAEMDSSRIWIKLVRLTKQTTRLRVSARKYRLPNLNLAQDLFIKIIEEAK